MGFLYNIYAYIRVGVFGRVEASRQGRLVHMQVLLFELELVLVGMIVAIRVVRLVEAEEVRRLVAATLVREGIGKRARPQIIAQLVVDRVSAGVLIIRVVVIIVVMVVVGRRDGGGDVAVA